MGKSLPTARSKRSGFSCPFSPIALLAIGLLVLQLVIFNIGLIFFHGNDDDGSVNTMMKNRVSREPVVLQRGDIDMQRFSNRNRKPAAADGIFNGYPIYFRKDSQNVETTSHCVGENFQEKTSWQKKSCEFSELFCFDTAKHDFVVFESTKNEEMYNHAESQPFIDISQSFLKKTQTKLNTVSLGGINLKWSEGISRLEWFPEIRKLKVGQSISYYELPSNVVMIPFHSMNGSNPGHLVWDDFLPIYTLLGMFQLKNKSVDLMLMRYVLKDQDRGLWASCDWTDDKKEACKQIFKKFLPLMYGSDPDQAHDEFLPTTEVFDFQLAGDKIGQSTLVCAKHGLAGIGALTDHGTSKLHGWENEDYRITQNHGRGGMLYEFRNFMLKNMQIPTDFNHKPPFRIVFSENSSHHRNFDFAEHKELLEKNFVSSFVSVESYVFSKMSLADQLEVASRASIFITVCGGGSVTAMFMPKGSSVIFFYQEDGGIVNNKPTGKPARLDWDLFNNMAYLKVHWLPSGTARAKADMKAFLLLIQYELDSLMRERSYDLFFN